ncbi:MAG: class I SAM-dependent methyltransferase [Gemmatimonadales bacterium]
MTAKETLPDPWSSVARAYQQHIVPGFKPGAEALCRYAGIKQGERVLDIGCGPGTASFAAEALGAEVTGVDSAKGMIALAEELDRSKPRITFLEGDLQKMPVPDAAFDVVISSFGIIFAAAPRHAVAEVVRVLVPGGRMAILVWPRSGAVGRYYDILDRHIPPGDSSDPHRWADLNQVREWLGGGFGPPASATVELPFQAKSPEAAWEILRTSTGRVAVAYMALAPEARQALDQEMHVFFKTYRKPEGTVLWPRKALMIRATKQNGISSGSTAPRSVVAVLAGYLSMAVLVQAGSAAAKAALLPRVTAPPTQTYLIATLVSGFLAAAVGGWVTARLAPAKPWHHVGAVAGLLVILTPLAGSVGGPGWYRWAIAGAGIAGLVLGALVRVGIPKRAAKEA